jgi:hypothetical protein
MRIRHNNFSSSFSKSGIKVQPYYEISKTNEEEEKKFVSPLEKPKKREIKNKSNQIIFYK